MCFTWRHDYGLLKTDEYDDRISSGMTRKEQDALRKAMAQIFDNDIAPNMEFKNE